MKNLKNYSLINIFTLLAKEYLLSSLDPNSKAQNAKKQ